jgi:ATP-dependent DNA helicase RecG
MERLRIIASSTDGFEIAEEDLRLRGAGHYLGGRQSGGPGFEGVSFHDAGPLVESAMEVLEPIFAADPGLDRPEHAVLRWAAVQTGGGALILSPEDAG